MDSHCDFRLKKVIQVNRVQKLKAQIDDLHAQIKEIESNQFFKCKHCKKNTKISKTILVRTYSYNEPYGCSGGADWSFSDYLVLCPKCNRGSRYYNPSTTWDKDRKCEKYEFIRKHSEYFAEHLDWYIRRSPGAYYLEQPGAIDVNALREEKRRKKDRGWY